MTGKKINYALYEFVGNFIIVTGWIVVFEGLPIFELSTQMQDYSGPECIWDEQVGTFTKDKPGNTEFADEGQ